MDGDEGIRVEQLFVGGCVQNAPFLEAEQLLQQLNVISFFKSRVSFVDTELPFNQVKVSCVFSACCPPN